MRAICGWESDGSYSDVRDRDVDVACGVSATW